VVRRQPNPSETTHHWYQSFAEHYDQDFAADPDRIAIDEKQIQLEEERRVWLYAAIDVDSKVALHTRLSQRRETEPATTFLRQLKEEHCVGDAEFLVDGMDFLTATGLPDTFTTRIEAHATDFNAVREFLSNPLGQRWGPIWGILVNSVREDIPEG
jgi:transposase-like protein